MKPTEHNAKPAVTPKIGRFATLRGLYRAPGSSAPARGLAAAPFLARSLMALCALAGLFAFATAGVAQAEMPRLISDGSFNPGAFPEGVAVDNSSGASSGDVYVAALAAANINKFDGSVPPSLISPPSPFGEGNFSGATVDPVNGDVYVVATAGHEVEVRPGEFETVYETVIDTYDPSTGALLSSFGVPYSKNFSIFPFTVIQIAADSVGNVYVPVVPDNEVLEYSPTGTLLHTFTGGAGALNGPTGVAVDSVGDLWVADSGNNRIVELSPSGAPVEVNGKPVEIKSEGVQDAIALDGHGDVLAIVKNGADFCGSVNRGEPPCSHLVEYDAAGAQVADLGAGSFELGQGPVPLPPMVAVDEKSGLVYVTDAKGEKVWVFARPTPPRVEKELSVEVGTSDVKLGAHVNPGGIPTTYRFEYDTREYREGEAPHGQSVPLPEGSVGEGLSSHTVWAAASGLAPGTTYHYRVVATSELAPEGVAGPDQTFTTETAEQAACPNGQFRGGFSAHLPDCRAYELVTPTTTTSVEIKGAGVAAVGGDAIEFETREPEPGAATASNFYVARRGEAGWAPEDIIPVESYSGTVCISQSNGAVGFSAELDRAVIFWGAGSRASSVAKAFGLECNAEGLQAAPGEPVGYQNLLLRESATGAFGLINSPEAAMAGLTPADAFFKAASSDLRHVVFTELAPLTENAPRGVEDLYEWEAGGGVRLVTVLPGETATTGSLVTTPNARPAISADGSDILFTSGGGLYARIDGKSTVQVDKSQAGGASGGGQFQDVSADGSKVFFTDESKLTAGSSAEAGAPDLYECVLAPGASECQLSDLTPEATLAKPGEHADVLRVSPLGSAEDSHVYFIAKGVLAENKREYEYTDAEGRSHTAVEEAHSGANNLYLDQSGAISYIATLGENEAGVGAVSPDGAWFAFDSRNSLTGYDNTPAGGGPVEEIFLYSAASGGLACASCQPSGEAPTAGAGANLLGGDRELSDGGRLFFQTFEALVPSDTNGQEDVYEYEAQDAQARLISGGTGASESTFQEASENGDDVFFLTRQQLVPQDTEPEASVIYDARVDGGIPYLAAAAACTNAEACRAPVAALPSVFGAPASQTFSGAGNLAPPAIAAKPAVKKKPTRCKKGYTKNKRGTCVKTSRKKTKSKAKRASRNRRAGR